MRGNERLRRASLRVGAHGRWSPPREVALGPERDFSAVVSIGDLHASTRYDVEARFRPRRSDLGARETIVRGSVRTFPPLDAREPFRFLHGSCNLSIVSLTNVGALFVGALGAMAAAKSLEHHGARRYAWGMELAKRAADALLRGRHVLQRLRARPGNPAPRAPAPVDESKLAWGLFYLIYKMTGFKQPEPIFPSPFAPLCKLLESSTPPAFMIHAGDQIYFDFPDPGREPSRDAYRLAYREAWFEDAPQRELLSRLPHYMILDDHEIVDDFALDHVPGSKHSPDEYLKEAGAAYDEYVGSRHPNAQGGERRWYEFEHGAARFLVLDTRTQRHRGEKRMLDEAQRDYLLEWLKNHRDRVKFVVSSVPFLAELATDDPGKKGTKADGASATPVPPDESLDDRDDKWAGRPYRLQRDRILDAIHRERIEKLVFLVGDMHCTYHATMRLGRPHRRVTLHELAGGPIHQAQFTPRSRFHDQLRGETCADKVPYRTWIQSFLGAATGVLQVDVAWPENATGTAPPKHESELRWKVILTGPSRDDGDGDFRCLAGRIVL